ncbi:helix-turn-helix domain-containing protein [Bradyrhizobium sp. CSA112]|uniref:helix-turn-helix domain-containing protein n=1 Tax=Bradyrhizobium sp. CSA112 TaxID=2699170 RepID=UPI0023B11925|nr:helix-turn-helix domain-containing protein [Bradyrhizobium sp. CSA112]MDE5455218.1 helix-turn-helix domain-containing protein [Bradyrhizobium sp. CSA112]
MLFQNLSPSPALAITQFSDIDAFRPVEFVADARSVPLNLANFHTARATVQLPGCQINLLTSFPRILDVSYRAAHGVVIFQIEDAYEVSVNGLSVNRPAFVGMRGNADLQFVEPRGSLHVIITLGGGLRDREWFDRPDELCPFTPDADALATVRSVTSGILQTASARPDLLQEPCSALAIQENLLLAIDEMFRRSRTPELTFRLANRNYCRLVRMVDEYVAFHPASAIYSADLAEQCGVSVRTLGTAMASVRGMSLHRYLRLKQLWSTRAQLVKGSDAITVTSCARANGFHHMGEFAKLYRATFQETASRTLARARGTD